MDPIPTLKSFFVSHIQAPSALSIPQGIDVYIDQDDTLVFTLPGLYQLLMSSQDIDYKAFRMAVYQSDLNQSLKVMGYQISIQRSSRKVDTSWYKLVTSV